MAAPRRVRPATRDRILEAATRIFVENGFNGASVDEIAARSGVSKPTVYSHFDSKEKLFVDILNGVCDRFSELIFEPGIETEPLEAVLLRIADRYTRTVLQADIVALHRLFVAEAARFPAPSRRYFEVGPERVHRTLAAFFASRMARGEIRKSDPLVMADLFAALVLGPMRARQLFGLDKKPNWKRIAAYNREAITLFIDGCGGAPRKVARP